QLGRAPFVVVRQRQAYGGQAESREQATESHVASRIGVPLRQDDDGARRLVGRRLLWTEDPGDDRVVDLPRRPERTREPEDIVREVVALDGIDAEKAIGLRDRFLSVGA